MVGWMQAAKGRNREAYCTGRFSSQRHFFSYSHTGPYEQSGSYFKKPSWPLALISLPQIHVCKTFTIMIWISNVPKGHVLKAYSPACGICGSDRTSKMWIPLETSTVVRGCDNEMVPSHSFSFQLPAAEKLCSTMLSSPWSPVSPGPKTARLKATMHQNLWIQEAGQVCTLLSWFLTTTAYHRTVKSLGIRL